MPDPTPAELALAALKRICAPTFDPTLDDTADLLPILADPSVLRASVWVSMTDYVFNSVVIPTVRNGHRYRLVKFDGDGIKSGATEPTWPKSNFAHVTDGNLTWQEDGADYASLYDIRQAAYLAWDLKCQRAAERYSVSSGGQVFQRNQLYEQCCKQRDRFLPVRIA